MEWLWLIPLVLVLCCLAPDPEGCEQGEDHYP